MALLETDDALRTLLRTAHTIAVVGLSDQRYRDSHQIASYLLAHGYTVLPVNPRIVTVLGLQVSPSLTALRQPVDIVDVFRRPEHVPEIVEQAIAIGAKAVWMQFGTGNTAAAERAAAAGLHVVRERCIMVEHRRLLG
jgi:predicted CoA-binding protein